jgi:hypothetical protein
MSIASPGNNPQLWSKFLDTLDERLQFGLLSHLKGCSSYHFEEATLFIEFEQQQEIDYFNKAATNQQLQILAKDILSIEKVIVRSAPAQC